ncbi:MAG: folylpolyglutamate synthase/dihydrofolate synthase family protein [Bacteroidota bacterium]
MDYQETINWMFKQLPMYQREGETAFKKDLTNILALSDHLQFPEKKFNSVHVAGTNGKGSTSHMIASVLQEAGYKVGLYTSPHLKDFRERIRINGKPISKKDVIQFIKTNKLFLEKQKVSFFEMTVAMALDYFAIQEVDFAVIEVGLGGRLDSTNIITPQVSVITNIGYDHTQFLGKSLHEIAYEKAGIIKYKVPVVIGQKHDETMPVFIKMAQEKQAKIYFADELIVDFKTDLLGDYQKLNVKTTVQTLLILQQKGFQISDENIEKGLENVVKNTNLKGRWQILQFNPKVICDTAHNKEGLTIVLDQLQKEIYKKLHIVLGVVDDKDLDTILPLFPKNAIYYFCKPNIPRGLDENILMLKSKKFDLLGQSYTSVGEAYNNALRVADHKDLIFAGGSTFVIAELPL